MAGQPQRACSAALSSRRSRLNFYREPIMRRIKVLIVDDSAVVRQVMAKILATAPDTDPLYARQKMAQTWPDVITLDIEMPRMDGVTFLRQLMAERPTPVVVCSSLAISGAETTIQALEAGAVSIITKPELNVHDFLHNAANDIVSAVRAAAAANLRNLAPRASSSVSSGANINANTAARLASPLPAAASAMAQTTERLVAIGTSTGGTIALEQVLTRLPRICPGIVVVQHMPAQFTAQFAARLDGICEIDVAEARHGQRVLPGLALIAPGGLHMSLTRSGAYYHVEIKDAPPVNRHKPSVDVLFRSVARHAGRNAMGIIMTGMGDDGARGLKEMHDAGAWTLAQDEETSVVYGMPAEAVKLGAVDRSLPLPAIAAALMQGPPAGRRDP